MEAPARTCGSCRQPLLEDGSEMVCQHCKFVLHVACLVKRFCPKCKCPVISEKQSNQYQEATRQAEKNAAVRYIGFLAAGLGGALMMLPLGAKLDTPEWIILAVLMPGALACAAGFWFLRKGALGVLALPLVTGIWFLGYLAFLGADEAGSTARSRMRLGILPMIGVVAASIQLEGWRKLSNVMRKDAK